MKNKYVIFGKIMKALLIAGIVFTVIISQVHAQGKKKVDYLSLRKLPAGLKLQ